MVRGLFLRPGGEGGGGFAPSGRIGPEPIPSEEKSGGIGKEEPLPVAPRSMFEIPGESEAGRRQDDAGPDGEPREAEPEPTVASGPEPESAEVTAEPVEASGEDPAAEPAGAGGITREVKIVPPGDEPEPPVEVPGFQVEAAGGEQLEAEESRRADDEKDESGVSAKGGELDWPSFERERMASILGTGPRFALDESAEAEETVDASPGGGGPDGDGGKRMHSEEGGGEMPVEPKENLRFGFQEEQRARMKVIGIGGAGSNAVDNMIISNLEGVDFIAVNTDMQALDASLAPRKVQIGHDLTKGLGAGGDPEIGRRSAEEDINSLRDLMDDTDMVFVTCGMGGGTGTGSAPIISALARERGILTVGIVTRPFGFEGNKRKMRCQQGIEEMKQAVDTLIVIPNDKLLAIIDEQVSFKDAFRKADEVLYQATKGISDIINTRGYVNVDFADVKAVMTDSGDAIMGVGAGEGERRAVEAAEAAITSPLLDNLSIEGARGVLINITGGESMGMLEVQSAVDLVTKRAGADADVYFGIVHDDSMGEKVSVTVIATGFNQQETPRSMIRVGEREEPTGRSRPKTQMTSIRERIQVGAADNGNGNAGPKNGNGLSGPRNGNGNVDHKNAEFIRVDAGEEDLDLNPDLALNTSAFGPIDQNNTDIPAFLRRQRGGRK